MDRPKALLYFFTFISICTFFDSGKRKVYQCRHTLRIMSSVILLIYTVYSVGADGFAFAKFHDGLFILMFFLVVDFSVIKGNANLAELVSFIMEPVIIGRISATRIDHIRRFFRSLMFYSIGPPIAIGFYGFIWPLIPSILLLSGYKTMQLDLPVLWMLTSENMWIFVATTVFIVIYMSANVSMSQGWFMVLSVSILKLKLMTELLADDLENLDNAAKERCERLLSALTATGRLPLCKKCKRSQTFLRLRERIAEIQNFIDSMLTDNECCRRAYRRELLQDCQYYCLRIAVVHHQKIIRISRTIDSLYRMTIWSYTQAAVIIVALVVPRLDNFFERRFGENVPALLEVIGAPAFFVVFCILGNLMLKQTEKIRLALIYCPWVDKTRGFKKSLLIMVTTAGKDLHLSAGGMYKLDLKLLSNYFLTIYSYAKIMQWLKKSS